MRLAAVTIALLVTTACAPGDGGTTGGAATDAPAPAGETVTVTETVTAPAPEAAPDGQAADPCAELGGEGAEVTDLRVLFVTSPDIGAAVDPGFTVTGCTNAFEAAFEWELVDQDGATLASDFGTATCGTGCLGTFSFQVDYAVPAPQTATLRVFTRSAQDGSEQDLNALPLRLRP